MSPEFRSSERVRSIKLVCCDCGLEAEGNVSCDGDELCDRCAEIDMSKPKTIRVKSSLYEDYDDCLTAAAVDYADDRNIDRRAWDFDPRWEGGDEGDREYILLRVPSADR